MKSALKNLTQLLLVLCASHATALDVLQQEIIRTEHIRGLTTQSLIVKRCATCEKEIYPVARDVDYFNFSKPTSNIAIRGLIFSGKINHLTVIKRPNDNTIYSIYVNQSEGAAQPTTQE